MDVLIVEGVDLTEHVEGLSDIEIEFGLGEDNTYGYTTSSKLTFKDAAFEFIQEKYFSDCQGFSGVLEVEYYSHVCGFTFKLHIDPDDVEVCGNCEASVTVSRIPPERKWHNYLEGSPYIENGFTTYKTHPRMEYCVQGGKVFEVLYFIVPLLAISLGVIFAICHVLRVILLVLSPIIFIIKNIFGGIIGFIGGIFDGRDDFEYFNTKLKDISDGLPCNELLKNLHYSNDPINLTEEEITTICSTGELNCFNIIWAKMPEQGDDDREKLGEFCDWLALRYSLEQAPDISLEDESVSFFINLPCDWADPCNVYDLVKGNDNWIQTPLLFDVVDYHTKNCGLKLIAPPLESMDYALFELDQAKGTDLEAFEKAGGYIKDASTTDTIVEKLDKWKKVFNAEWIIRDNTLYFDRIDKIEALSEELTTIDALQAEGRLIEYPCIKYKDTFSDATMRTKYCEDFYDSEGNDVKSDYGHKKFINWNEDNAIWKKGIREVDLPIGTARFMFDKKTLEDTGLYNWNYAIDVFRATGKGNIGQLVASGIPSLIINEICNSPTNHAIIVGQSERTTCSKILALDPTSDYKDSKVLKRPIGQRGGHTCYDYNYPLKMKKFDENGVKYKGGLYHDYHSINEPEQAGRELYEIENLKWKFTCEEVRRINESPFGWYIDSKIGKIHIKTLKVNFKDCTITAQNMSVRCG